LKHFKNFQDATLMLGSFTVLIGANASGKSNIRDAFLFLHGIGRGYSLAEILGEKYVGGERVWGGIRGGIREVAYWGLNGFALTARLNITSLSVNPPGPYDLDYRIEVFVGGPSKKSPPREPPRIDRESLNYADRFVFQTKERVDKNNVKVVVQRDNWIRGKYPPARSYISGIPIVYQVSEDEDNEGESRLARLISRKVIQNLESFRLLDLSPGPPHQNGGFS